MAIKSILVPIDGSDAAKPTLETAFTVAGGLGAHVDVLHVRADPKAVVPLLGEGMSGAMIEDMIRHTEKESATRADAARAMFDERCGRDSIPLVSKPAAAEAISANWIEETGREEEIVASLGKLTDLVVVSRPGPDSDLSASLTMNAALFETGKPVLVVPPGGAGVIGEKVAIAWNGSVQAARAVTAAMPLMENAKSAVILTAESSRTKGVIASDLAASLAWHGITADVRTVEPVEGSVGRALLGACADSGVDLLVMGAYTRSRLRELILGGVTRRLLAEAELPLFMAR